jgi:hypothetical protein
MDTNSNPKKGKVEKDIGKKILSGNLELRKSMNHSPKHPAPTSKPPTNYVKPPTDKKD